MRKRNAYMRNGYDAIWFKTVHEHTLIKYGQLTDQQYDELMEATEYIAALIYQGKRVPTMAEANAWLDERLPYNAPHYTVSKPWPV